MIIKTKIEFEFDSEELLEQVFGDGFTDEELIEYCKETMHEDILSFWKHGELYDAIEVEVVNG